MRNGEAVNEEPEFLLWEHAAAKVRVNLACDQYYASCSSCMTDAVAALTGLLNMSVTEQSVINRDYSVIRH